MSRGDTSSSESRSSRDLAIEIVRTLRDKGKTAYLAGGCVRDELLGLNPSDYDVATDATPNEIASIFPRTSLVGAAFGVVLVHQGKGETGKGRTTEVATFRTDIGYGDKRRPDRVEFTDAAHDAQRRDFTINALFLDPLETEESKRVIDFVGGLDDLDARLVRCVGVADERLNEDHLRALRAVRFACRLGFDLDTETADAIRAHASELAGVSRERVGDELRKMLSHQGRAAAVSMLSDLSLDVPLLGPADSLRANWVQSLESLPAEAGFPLALSALAIGRHGEGLGGRDAIVRWRTALCLSNEERDAAWRILETFGFLRTIWDDEPVARQKRIAMARSFPDALALLGAIDQGRAAQISDHISDLKQIGMGLAPASLLNGEALIRLGLTPGPMFARILDGVYDAQLDGRVMELSSAGELARELAAEYGV